MNHPGHARSPEDLTAETETAVVLFGHGSRDPVWREPMERVAEVLRRRPQTQAVLCAYLELCEPDLFTAVAGLQEKYKKLQTVVIYPFFLGMGTHMREDMPLLCEQLARRHGRLHISLAPALGTSDRLVALTADLVQDLVQGIGTSGKP